MTNISKTIADKQLKELGVVEDKPVFSTSAKTVGELYDEVKSLAARPAARKYHLISLRCFATSLGNQSLVATKVALRSRPRRGQKTTCLPSWMSMAKQSLSMANMPSYQARGLMPS